MDDCLCYSSRFIALTHTIIAPAVQNVVQTVAEEEDDETVAVRGKTNGLVPTLALR